MKSFFLACAVLVSVWHATGQIEDFNTINFRKADSIAMLYPKHSLNNLVALAYKLTERLTTDVEKFRAIYRWTCANIGYDPVLYQKNQQQRKKLKDPEALRQWYQKASAMMFETLLRKHRTICTGYAYLVRELARHAGLKCEIIDGYGRNSISNVGGMGTPSHQWNAVQLNGKWYLCDATWSSGSVLTPMGWYAKDYNDSYFLMAPELFVRNHYPLDTAWVLLANKPTLDEFLNRPLIYSKLLALKTTALMPETFEITAPKKAPVTLQFNAGHRQPMENISLTIQGGAEITFPPLQPDPSGFYSIGHTFSSRGTYVMHVSQNKQYLFSYKVKVQ